MCDFADQAGIFTNTHLIYVVLIGNAHGAIAAPPWEHCEGAQKFYRDLATQGKKVRVGMEASGHARWFERLLGELNIELWVGVRL